MNKESTERLRREVLVHMPDEIQAGLLSFCAQMTSEQEIEEIRFRRGSSIMVTGNGFEEMIGIPDKSDIEHIIRSVVRTICRNVS